MFQIHPLPSADFAYLNELSASELAERNIKVCISDGGFPCRVSLADVPEGEKAFLLNFEHQPGASPYRSRHAIFVKEGASEHFPEAGTVPDMLTRRLLSVRAFNAAHEIVDADVAEGSDLARMLERMFADPQADYIHVHFARPGCFAAKATRLR